MERIKFVHRWLQRRLRAIFLAGLACFLPAAYAAAYFDEALLAFVAVPGLAIFFLFGVLAAFYGGAVLLVLAFVLWYLRGQMDEESGFDGQGQF